MAAEVCAWLGGCTHTKLRCLAEHEAKGQASADPKVHAPCSTASMHTITQTLNNL